MDDRKLFADIPDDFAGVTDEDLAGLLAAHMEGIDRILADDPEFLGDLDAKQILDQMAAGVEAVERIKAEVAVREEAQETFEATKAELAAKVKPVEELAQTDTDEPDEESDNGDEGDEPVAETEAEEPVAETATDLEPVLAAAPVVRRRLPRPSLQHQAPPAELETFVAAAGIRGYQPGQALTTKLEIAKAMVAAQDTSIATPKGFRDKVPVATYKSKDAYPEDRRLLGFNYDAEGFQNWNLIEQVTRPNGSLVAAGGLCAPVTPYYGQQFIATVERPVRDALVAFNADRGGINYNPPTGIGLITGSDAIGVVTADEDAEGGTFAQKTCLEVVCVGPTEVDVNIIFHCVTWSNLTARTFPERVAQISDTVMAGWARLAETLLLNTIKAGSTNVTQANTNLQGASSTLLGSVLTAAAGLRSRQRMRADATLRALFPAWARDLLIADIVRSQFQRFDMSEAELVGLLRSYNIEPSFYLDGPSTGTGQVFGAQAGGALDPFPTEVQWALFPEGTWLFLDGGVLELGIVRDSILNAQNQFQIFGESFENAANVGIESLWITTSVCPSGTVAAGVDNSDFCGA